MAYKRQNTDQLESLRSAKKTIESEFNGTTFKSMLRDPGNAFKGLENFVRTAKKLPCASVYDVVEGYIKISAECSEILSLLEGDKQSVTEMMLIFQSLELILLRTASDLSHFSMVGTTIVKKLVSTHAKLLQSSLHSVNHPFVRQCLTLLAAMVSQGANSAREVFCSLVFSKPLNSLARHRDKSGRPDVRMAYVQFAVSFLLCGDGSLVGQMLDTKDFLSEILNTGLKEDRISVVSLILSTLQTKVVHNPAISKSKKVRFFSASTLAQIASLYKWNGIVDTLTVHSQEGGKLLVRELVHNFLLDLCCSHKHGISFHDPSLGTAMRAGNIVLLQFVVGLKQATEDELVSELLVSILKSSPDILPRYFRETHLSFTPRMKGAWLDSVALLKKIYQAQPEVSQAFQLQETVSAHNLLSMVLVTSLPPVCNKTFFTQGFKLPSMMGQHATVSMLAFILRRAQRNMENRLDAYSPTTMEEFVLLYREALSKILPDVMSIVSIWQSLSKKKEGDANTSATELKVGKEVKTEDYDEQNSKEVLFKALLLQVLCLYQRVVPHLISQSRFDFSKLLKGIVSERGMENDIPPFLQCEILKLALELPASSFSWFRLQDVANSELIQGEGSVFHLLLKIFISTRSSQLRTLTRMLILKVLRDCSVFEHTSRELELWVDHLLSSEPLQQEQVIQFLDQVLMRVMCNPYIYLEKVAAMLQEAVCLQTEMSGQDQKGCNLPVSHISDRQSSFAVIEESETSLKGTFLIDDILQTFPFSAIVPAVLEARNKLLLNFRDENDVVCEYICAVLCHILHYQRDPLTLCLTLKHYDDELFSSENSRVPHSSLMLFCVYYSKWLPQQPQETQFSLTRPTAAPTALDFSSFLKTCYSEGHQAFVQDSFRPALEKYLSSLQLSQFTGAVNQVLLYLRSIVDAFSSLSRSHAAEMVNCLLEVLGALVLKLYNTAETQINQPEAQEPDEVSIEMNHAAAQEVSKEQILLVVFRSVFKHPVLEQWFLAVELDVVPPHSLEQDCVRHLGAQLTECILNLLQSSAEKIRALHALEVISSYLSASQQALLKELHHSTSCLKEGSWSVKAFLALYEYMDPSSVKEVLSALLLLPQSSLLVDDEKLSVYGHAVLTLLSKSSAPHGKDITLCLSSAHLRSLAALHTSCHCAQLEDVLLQVLQRDPSNAKLVPTDVLVHCLQRLTNPELAALLVQNCSTHCLSFELWCLEQNDLTCIIAPNSSFLCLLTSYIQQATTLDPCRPKDIQTAVLKMLTKTLVAELLSAVLQMEASLSLDQCMEIFSSLIHLEAMTPTFSQLIHDLPALLKTPDGYERWHLADCLTEKLTSTSEELHWRTSLLSAAFHWLSTTYKELKKPEVKKEEVMLRRLKTLLISPESVRASDWNIFVKCGLKYRYQDKEFLATLNTLMKRMYRNVNASKGLLAIETLYVMITSHSLFMPTILASHIEADSSTECKEALVSLLLTLVRKCPEVCNRSHLPVLFGAYGATLSLADQKLLLLLNEYEKKNIDQIEFQCLLWGPAAVEYHKARKQLGTSLWQHPSSEQLLAQLAPDKMLNTVTHFPLHRCLMPQEGEELIYITETEDMPNQLCLYDPSFLFPLFSFILRPESVIDCQKFVTCHALGVTIVALSSHDLKMRSAAFHVLSSFYEHLEGARFRDKKQLLYLLDSVRNGIQKHNLRISFVHTTYIAKVAQQILRPEEHMYLVINKFLLGTPYVGLSRVPDFFKLFYSFDLEHKLERQWMLSVLEEGMMDRLSFDLCEQQNIYHALLGFCSSPLCDQPLQIQIVNILKRSVRITKAAYDLTKVHGVLTWIIQLIEKRCLDARLLSAVIGLLHSLWFTNLGQKESVVQCSKAADFYADGSVRCFTFPVINDFLCALLSVIRHLRIVVEAKEVQSFLQTLASVLRSHKMALGAHKDAGWLTVHPHSLSCSSALSLLYCWGTLVYDQALLFVLQDLANTHNIRGLYEAGKEGVQVNASSKLSQSSLEHLNEVADSGMEDFKPLLLNVLTYWEPLPVLTSSNLCNDDIPVSICLICGTAHTLIKWTLKALLERPNESKTCATVNWLHRVILSHKTIAKSLITDEAVKVDLLRLYHHTCECRMQEKSTSKLDTLELFTTIMVYLLEAQGIPNVLQTSEMKAYLETPSVEVTKKV
ncbi:nucleolar pre-ribosomal-associated protein 1 isoform X2 [Salminus brasiliensis]|uniref:nucleolar pre-ribosomal-associated protein 1 isoform X2 n=1 Tax=Salminus brasiliensis TaxID=930266 RepID=UPI003B836498